jgi:hypothetical protein
MDLMRLHRPSPGTLVWIAGVVAGGLVGGASLGIHAAAAASRFALPPLVSR